MLKQLTEHIRYLPACEQGDRPALAYILGQNRALMVDAGNSPAHARLFLRFAVRRRMPSWPRWRVGSGTTPAWRSG